MRTFQLEKLVRDGIVQNHMDEGGEVEFEVLAGEDLTVALEAKLAEEQAELDSAKTDEEKHKEQRDVNDILFALGRLGSSDYSPHNTFNDGHYIHTVTMPEESWLTEYYASDPARFPEVTR